MTEPTNEIMQDFNTELGRIGDGLEATKDGLRHVVGEGGHTADTVVDVLNETYAEADTEYAAAVEQRNSRLAERAAELRAELFGAPAGGAAGVAFTNALTQAAAADADGLTALAELAATTGDDTLGRAVFAVSVQRGRSDIGIPYLEANPEMRETFAELGQMPARDELERGASFRFPRPNLQDLRPTAHEGQQAEQIEAARRVQRAMQANSG